jgi:hypothetical protein
MTAVRVVCALGLAGALAIVVVAQEKADPRVGLKPGLRDAGQAIHNLSLVATLSKPDGFFDPSEPAGPVTEPERPAAPAAAAGSPAATTAGPDAASGADAPAAAGAATAPRPPAPYNPVVANRPSYFNSDLAFDRTHLFMGNYHGFNAYDIESGKSPRLIASIVCPGGQGDVSVHGHLLFMSVEQTRGRLDCGTQGTPTAISAERFRGVRIFDISDLKKPRQVAAVQTCRGSHTHTLVSLPSDPANVYVYGSGTGTVRSPEELAGCSDKDPKEDTNTALFSIDVIQVPIANPEKARIVNRPRIFADPATGALSGLWQGGNHGEGTQTSRETRQCHDITVFPELGLAAGACTGNGILMDISDPVHPVRLDHVVDKAFSFWHSATFNNDGTKVVFTDEWGGGTRPRCRVIDPPTWGGDAIFDIVDRKLKFAGYYKMPAPQTEQENCVAHNGSLIPIPGRDVMVQSWYQGGISVFDFTDSAHPFEIAYFDRGPIDAEKLVTGGYWSSYWFNGRIYAAEIARGLDVFTLQPSEFLSQNEIAAAVLVQSSNFNAQRQTKIAWPSDTVVARAYLDQLGRSKAISMERATEIRAVLDRADRAQARRGSDREISADLTRLATALDADATNASAPADASRLRAIAAGMRARLPRMR